MSPRDRWLAEGLAVLAAEGAAAVRVDRIATRLGLTKGSFHHHFRGAEDYRSALLDRYERDQTNALEQLADALADTPPDSAIMTLPTRVADLIDTDLERAVRAWSLSDAGARTVQERLDSARLAFLRRLWGNLLGDDHRAHTAALVPHLLAIGASVAQPRLTNAELQEVYDLLAALVPSVPAGARTENAGALHHGA